MTTAPPAAGDRLAQRLERLRLEPAYMNYQRVREEVFRMKDAEHATGSEPSAYWREELGNFEYMLDASPLIVEKLRHHSYHVTGLRVYDYRSHAHERQAGIEEKLAALRSVGGDGLRVVEPPELGGFGFHIDGGLYNLDTLKFYEALIALEKAEVLGQFRATKLRIPFRATKRHVVVEVGPGWGGFAYQFHTLFPNTCYVLVDLPELFLFSAVYLMTLFPSARVAFWDDARPLPPHEIPDYDFVFVPQSAFEKLACDEVALAINMVSFQEMTTAQVASYADGLHRLGCRFLYSLNRDRSLYNSELTNAHEILASRYSLSEIAVLPVQYTVLPTRQEMDEEGAKKKTKKTKKTASRPVMRYRHMAGSRRADVG
jgi:hypothetical protein